MTDLGRLPRSNPFSTRFVRPGAIAYAFGPGESAAGLVARLGQSGWRGQIVGPHGSGKSTLLAHLAAPLAEAGRRLWSIQLRDATKRMPTGWVREAVATGANLIAIDGYEQLGLASRMHLRWQCGRRGWGLLVTTHRDVGLPTLLATSTDLATAGAIVTRLVGEASPVDARAVAECYLAAGGDVREMLFALYDRWEARRG